MCVSKPSLVDDPDLDEVDKAAYWLKYLLREYHDCRDGKVPVRNPQHLFGTLEEIHRLLVEYRSK